MSTALRSLRRPNPSFHRRLGFLLRPMSVCIAAVVACPASAAEAEPGPARPGWLHGVGGTIGSSDGEAMLRVALVSDWKRGWAFWGGRLTGYWDGSIGYWDVAQKAGRSHGLFDVGFTPMLRFVPGIGGAVVPYFEAGVGIHLLSHTVDAESHQVSTAFQFGDQAGVGLRFGEGGRYELGYRFLHLSNGGIKHPNGGIDFHLLRLGYRMD